MYLSRHKPTSINDFNIHLYIVEELKKYLQTPNNSPHILFEGPPGTGKTTLARAFSNDITQGNTYNILELNASNERGIDIIRGKIYDFISAVSFKTKTVKVVILDEADYLTKEAQAALRQMMEIYSENSKFVLTCNYVEKLDAAILSRCKRFYMGRLPKEEITVVVNELVKRENLHTSQKHLSKLITYSNGDLRYIINNLDTEEDALVNNIIENSNFITSIKQTNAQDISKLLNNKIYSKLSGKTIINYLYNWAINNNVYAVADIAEVDYRLTVGCTEKIQITALCIKLKTNYLDKESI